MQPVVLHAVSQDGDVKTEPRFTWLRLWRIYISSGIEVREEDDDGEEEHFIASVSISCKIGFLVTRKSSSVKLSFS